MEDVAGLLRQRLNGGNPVRPASNSDRRPSFGSSRPRGGGGGGGGAGPRRNDRAPRGGGGGGGGRGGRGGKSKEPTMTAEELDAQLDAYNNKME